MRFKVATLAFACAVIACAEESAVSIVKRSLDLEHRNWERAKDYTYRSRSVTKETDGAGRLKSTSSRTYDVLMVYGRPYMRLVEKDDKPLNASEERKQQERLDKTSAKRRAEAEDPNSKERHDYEKRRADERKFLNEIPEAYAFTIAGEEMVSGKPAWVITAEPKSGYQPRDSRAKMFTKIRGKLWIDKAEYQWVKIQAEVTDTISFGFFLARLSRGSSLRFESTRVNDEVWLPSHAEIAIDARLALVKKIRAGQETTFWNYRKFQTDSRVVTTSAVP